MRSGLYIKNTSTHLFFLVLEAGSWRSGCRRGLGLSEPLRTCLRRVGEWFWAEGRQLRGGEVEKAGALVCLLKGTDPNTAHPHAFLYTKSPPQSPPSNTRGRG